MENEEKFIIERCGKSNAFRTPEGYFDQLQKELIKRTTQKRIKILPLRKHTLTYVGIAASLLLLLGLTVYTEFDKADNKNRNMAEAGISENFLNEQDDVDYTDYSLLDNDAIYSLLASN